jgi:hypothetical protein
VTTEIRSKERDSEAPFASPEKSARYETERYRGATGLNWYACDPSLQRTLRFYMQPKDYDWAQPYLAEWGALMGGLVTRAAEETDRDPPQLVKYDRWGNDVSEVVIPEASRRARGDLRDATLVAGRG